MISSEAELHRHGLINRLVAIGRHLEAAEELEEKVRAAPPLVTRDAARLTRSRWIDLANTCDAQIRMTKLHLTEDFKEAGRTFIE